MLPFISESIIPVSSSLIGISITLFKQILASLTFVCKFIIFFIGSKKYNSKELNVKSSPKVIVLFLTNNIPTPIKQIKPTLFTSS